MKDTPPFVQDMFRSLLMNRSGAERLKMGCEMFDAARKLARASLEAEKLDEEEIRVRLFVRTYGRDFDRDTLDQIIASFRGQCAADTDSAK